MSDSAPVESADQAEDSKTSLKASMPLIIFVSCAVGGVALIILLGLIAVKLYKRRREKKQLQQHQESHEQWLARQNLQREEVKNHRMSFGGWFGKRDSIQGKHVAAGGARPAGQMELGVLTPLPDVQTRR